MDYLKKNFVLGLLWSFAGQSGYLTIALISNIILARMLSPQEFGQVGIVMFFIIISRVLTESGLSGALIRKNRATEEDFSTVFVFNLAISFLLFILLLLFSGAIARFYGDNSLQNILQALSFILVINAFQFTQDAKMVRDLKFKKQSLYLFVAVFCSSFIGVYLASLEYGVWALVIMQISNAFIITLIYWIFEGPVKSFVFKKESFKTLYKFGVNTTFASLLNSVFDNIYNLVLGKFFSIQLTGLFYQAKKLQEVPVGLVRSSTLGVVFSTLCKLQDDEYAFSKFYNRIIRIFTSIVGLICLLVFYFSEQSILLLYGKQWIGAVFFMKILIIASFFYMQETLNRVIFKVFDRTDKILYLEVVKKSIQALTIVIGVWFQNLELLLYGFLLTSVISYLVNYYHCSKVYKNISWLEIIMVLKVFISAVSVAFITDLLNEIVFNLEGYHLFYLLPVIVIFYFLFVLLLNVFDLYKEIQNIFTILKKRS